jgi:cell wall-associated NlpC family hydrolase
MDVNKHRAGGRKLKKFFLLWLLIGLIVILAAGCSSIASRQGMALKPDPGKASTPAHADPLEQRLRSEVRQWVGTPHRMGGASRRGTDCSGFVQRLYRDIFQQGIPRSTTLQVRTGHHIEKKQLRPGDLVFFKIPYKGPHVGIYLGRQEFAHASTSQGVMISSLREDYWRSAYWTARRYRTAIN